MKFSFEKEQKEIKSLYEKKQKETENRFNEEIEKLRKVFIQTNKSLECKMLKENEATNKQTKEIMDKLKKTEECVNEVKKTVDKITEVKETESKNVETITNKPEPKKLTKEDRENEVISEFENDCNDIFESRKNCGLDLSEIKCKTCRFETHSEGLLRKHKRTKHDLKETNAIPFFNTCLPLLLLCFYQDMNNKFKNIERLAQIMKHKYCVMGSFFSVSCFNFLCRQSLSALAF